MKRKIKIFILAGIFFTQTAVFCHAEHRGRQFKVDREGMDWKSGRAVYPSNMVNIEQFIYLDEYDDMIVLFRSVSLDVNNLSAISETIKRTGGDTSWAEDVLDIGTGSGAIGFLMIASGAKHVVGTDIDLLAIKNSIYNAKKLNIHDKFEARLVSMEDTSAYAVIGADEKFDLIVSDPPQDYSREYDDTKHSKALPKKNFFRNDPSGKLLISIVTGLKDHLKEDGKMWISLRHEPAKELLLQLVEENDLNVRILFSGEKDLDYDSIQLLPSAPPKKAKLWYETKTASMRRNNVYEVTVKK